ncbi:hypothetical protein CsSME_00005509 [Camellia sinensis var. sinensis]
MMIMVDNYIVGTFFASLLGFLLLYILRSRNATVKPDNRPDHHHHHAFDEIRNDCVRSSINGQPPPDGGPDTDVIIVGAGVAGAALAHTLGKVTSSSFFLALCLFPWKKDCFSGKTKYMIFLGPVCFTEKVFPWKKEPALLSLQLISFQLTVTEETCVDQLFSIETTLLHFVWMDIYLL